MKEKICNFEASEVELRRYLEEIESEGALKDSGAYSLDTILKCIDLYGKGEVSCGYLELWAKAYAYLFDILKEENSKKEFLLVAIADCIRSMATDKRVQNITLEWARDTFVLLDSIYKNTDSWDLCYSVVQKRYPTDEVVSDIEAVFTNAENMSYIILYKSFKGEFPIFLEGKYLSLTELNLYEAQLGDYSFTRLKKF
jgi:hypothetical protein